MGPGLPDEKLFVALAIAGWWCVCKVLVESGGLQLSGDSDPRQVCLLHGGGVMGFHA